MIQLAVQAGLKSFCDSRYCQSLCASPPGDSGCDPNVVGLQPQVLRLQPMHPSLQPMHPRLQPMRPRLPPVHPRCDALYRGVTSDAYIDEPG